MLHGDSGEGAERAKHVKISSPAPDPAAAFRDALRSNPVASFAVGQAPNLSEWRQSETGERKVGDGEESLAPLAPKKVLRDGDQESFVGWARVEKKA